MEKGFLFKMHWNNQHEVKTTQFPLSLALAHSSLSEISELLVDTGSGLHGM